MRPDRLPAAPLANGSDPGRRPDPATPPDLDQLWRDFNQRINAWFGLDRGQQPAPDPQRQPGWRPSLGLVLGVLLLLAWLASGWHNVDPGQQASLSLLGRRSAIVGPGQHWYWPAPLGQVRLYDLRATRRLEVGAGDGAQGAPLLSADRRLLDLRLQLEYRITDLPSYIDHAANPDQQLAAMAQAQLRADVLGHRAGKLLAADHDGIAPQLLTHMQQALASAGLGLQLQQVNVVLAQAPVAALTAADQLQQQLEQARQQLTEARAQAQAQRSADAAQSQSRLQQAHAAQQQQLRQARDDADRFAALLPSYARAPQTTLDTVRQQTLVEVLKHADKVVVDASRAHPVIRIGSAPAAPASVPASPVLPASSAPSRELTRDRNVR